MKTSRGPLLEALLLPNVFPFSITVALKVFMLPPQPIRRAAPLLLLNPQTGTAKE